MASQEDMMLVYGLLQSAPGKTMAQKLNWLQDIAGFNPLGKSVVPFQESAPPMVYNQYDVYGSNPDMARAFDLIQNRGVDPLTAAQETGIPTQSVMGGESPELKALMGWAETNARNQAQLQQWQMEQDVARQKYEASQPITMKDITGRTAYDAMSEAAGQPLTAEGLVSAYARNKQAKGKPINVPIRGPMAETGGGMFAGRAGEMLRKNTQAAVGRKLGKAKQTFLPSEKGQQLLDLMKIYSAMGG